MQWEGFSTLDDEVHLNPLIKAAFEGVKSHAEYKCSQFFADISWNSTWRGIFCCWYESFKINEEECDCDGGELELINGDFPLLPSSSVIPPMLFLNSVPKPAAII